MTDDQLQFTPDADLVRQIDEWRTLQVASPTRVQAIEDLIKAGLRGPSRPSISLGEKLILSILCDVSRKVGAEGLIDPDFLEAAVKGGHSWAIEWEHPSLSHSHTNTQSTADFVIRVLTMWRLIEESFGKLTDQDKDLVRQHAGITGAPLFPGWDSEQEANYKSTARIMTEQMNLFPMFIGRAATDSNRPALDRYKRMLLSLTGFDRIGSDQPLDAAQLSALLAID